MNKSFFFKHLIVVIPIILSSTSFANTEEHKEVSDAHHSELGRDKKNDDKVEESRPEKPKVINEVLSDEQSFISEKSLLSGSHWIRNTKKFELITPYGKIHSTSGNFFVATLKEANLKKVYVVNHYGILRINLRDGSSIEIPQGFEFWFSEIDENRKTRMGQIQPVELATHLKKLARLWDDGPETLKTELLQFQSRWGDRVKIASFYYKGLAQRKIAQVESAEKAINDQRRKRNLERIQNKKLLFDRTFGR
jgi:hypothetical protein